ncbi:hypothetical protein KCH_44940 [Kitasatospora cheerisanensis KCTC 2395]|uniref:Uncharacterized protein n=1 Tax=Kitasatospora cheerisanensis KCTC 2395 TaxID=1348663 RepID=A0A066Z107_9ACTN|nr:hypothetical protein KCH_44940 [Kitasatospora cheerisanensis KCTC 2395]
MAPKSGAPGLGSGMEGLQGEVPSFCGSCAARCAGRFDRLTGSGSAVTGGLTGRAGPAGDVPRLSSPGGCFHCLAVRQLHRHSPTGR